MTEVIYSPLVDGKVAEYLRLNNMTQAQLAEQLGMTENSFSWKRRGIREFKWSEIKQLADLIGFSLDEAAGRTMTEEITATTQRKGSNEA